MLFIRKIDKANISPLVVKRHFSCIPDYQCTFFRLYHRLCKDCRRQKCYPIFCLVHTMSLAFISAFAKTAKDKKIPEADASGIFIKLIISQRRQQRSGRPDVRKR